MKTRLQESDHWETNIFFTEMKDWDDNVDNVGQENMESLL